MLVLAATQRKPNLLKLNKQEHCRMPLTCSLQFARQNHMESAKPETARRD